MTRWLQDEEQQVWRGLLHVMRRLPVALARQMTQGLSMPDYEVMVALSESPERTSRVAPLAERLAWERSRTSHHLGRMEARGLVSRRSCAEDGRGALVTLTPEGLARLEAAAPDHVGAVRSIVFESLDDRDLRDLDRIMAKLAAGLESAS